jgi:hypothetical protein
VGLDGGDDNLYMQCAEALTADDGREVGREVVVDNGT